MIYEPDGSPLTSVGHLMAWLFEGPQMQELLAANAIHLTEEEPYLFCELTHELPSGAYLVTNSGRTRPLREAVVLARCRTEDLEIALEHGSLGQARSWSTKDLLNSRFLDGRLTVDTTRGGRRPLIHGR
jgi:hypothetical protein